MNYSSQPQCQAFLRDLLQFWLETFFCNPLQWRHNGCDSVSNRRHFGCLLNRLFRRRSKKTSKLRFAGLCEGNSPGTGEFPAQRASNAENVSIWWRHHALIHDSFLFNNSELVCNRTRKHQHLHRIITMLTFDIIFYPLCFCLFFSVHHLTFQLFPCGISW